MKNLFFILPLFFFACNNSNKEETQKVETAKMPAVVKKDSVITLQLHVKKGQEFHFGYVDEVFNFNMIETPEKPDTTVYVKTIISHKPLFLRDIDYRNLNFFYLIPGETYKVTQDAELSNFEVVNNPKRTYEVNVLKELKKHSKKSNKFHKYDMEESYAIRDFKNMDLKYRDSLLKNDYEENVRFIDSYTSKNDFDNTQKQSLYKYLLYKYYTAKLNFNMKNPQKVKKYLSENKELYTNVLKELNCDTCFNYPNYDFLVSLFAKSYVSDINKKSTEKVYQDYNNFFKGKTKDYLLYELIKLGGMFNYTKPNPALAKQFLIDAKDPALKNYIKEMYEFLELNKSAKGMLADISGKSVSWEKIVEKHKGKVVYVDFWASWCGPCRKEMPSSKLLQKQFKGKEMVFIYVSLDENNVDWKKASQLEGIPKNESYIMIQPDKSGLRKQYKISSIPRYFLINKSGKIVNSNAQRPSDSKVVKEIEMLL